MGYLKKYLLNYEFFMDLNAYQDIINSLSLISIALQPDSVGALSDASNLINKLRLKLSTFETMAGENEIDITNRFENGTDVNSSEISNLVQHTRHFPFFITTFFKFRE